jgi:hypothetical protein
MKYTLESVTIAKNLACRAYQADAMQATRRVQRRDLVEPG